VSRKEINASAALERLMATYGFKQQKELAEHLGIHGNNVSSWLARNSIPSSVLLECALDTGVDVHWLAYGEFANASFKAGMDVPKGKALYDEVMSNGGKAVLRRIMDAYGFNTQKQLCDLLDISSGTVSTWVRREYFPGDVVVTCALDTGVSLRWLSTGEGKPYQEEVNTSENRHPGLVEIQRYLLNNGTLTKKGTTFFDHQAFPDLTQNDSLVTDGKQHWYIDLTVSTIGNGSHLLDIDGYIDIYEVSRLPANKISVKRDGVTFECVSDSVRCAGAVRKTICTS